jgi:hypothetical protein
MNSQRRRVWRGKEKKKRKKGRKGKQGKVCAQRERGRGGEGEGVSYRRNVVLDGVKDVVILLAMLRSEDTLPK